MQELTDSTRLIGDADALRAQLTSDGYLYLPRFLPDDHVGYVRTRIAEVLRDAAWTAPGTDPGELVASDRAVGEGQPEFFGAYTAIQMIQEFHELAHEPALTSLVERVLGEPAFVRPAHICRVSPPVRQAPSTPPHQDYRLIQGAVDSLTAWIPLADSPSITGGLRVLEGSHRDGLLPAVEAVGPGGHQNAIADDDPRWRTTEFSPGDVLMFLSLTVHAAVPNLGDKFRLSADFRYHPVAEPVATADGRFRPHYYPGVPDYPTLTRHWTSLDSIRTPDGLTHVDKFETGSDTAEAPLSRFVTAVGPGDT